MARIICEYCSTEYDDTLQRCPLCGTVNDAEAAEAPPERERTPARSRARSAAPGEGKPRHRVAKPERPKADGDRIPRWIMVLICVILGIAVVIGALYALYALGAFTPKKDTQDDSSASLDLPIADEDPPKDQAQQPDTAPGGEQQPAQPEPSGEIACTNITVSPAVIRLEKENSSALVTPTVLPAGCTDPVVWQSADESICIVDSTGIITAVDGGKTTVRVTCGDKATEVEVNCDFPNSKENNATLSSTDFTLFSKGEQATLTVNDPPRDAEITWTSSDTGVCTVKDGVVTATGGGTATVTATVNERELTCTVRCNIPGYMPATPGNAEGGDRLDHDDVTLEVGGGFEISVVGGVSGGWNVTDASVISVDGNGNVKALASGTASVYTVVGGKRLECIVRVK